MQKDPSWQDSCWVREKQGAPDSRESCQPRTLAQAFGWVGKSSDSSQWQSSGRKLLLPGCPEKTEGPKGQMAGWGDWLPPELAKVASLTPVRW